MAVKGVRLTATRAYYRQRGLLVVGGLLGPATLSLFDFIFTSNRGSRDTSQKFPVAEVGLTTLAYDQLN